MRAKEPVLHAELLLKGLDLSADVPSLTDLNGSVRIDGTLHEYAGRLSLLSKGALWQSATVEADFKGTATGIKATSLNVKWLGGTIAGSGSASWAQAVSAGASLRARGLDLSLIAPAWTGAVNMDAIGQFDLSGKRNPRASVSARLLPSMLRGKNVQGVLNARLVENELTLDRLELNGTGFALRAGGRLTKGLRFSARLSDLALLSPSFKGSVTAKGSVRKSGDAYSGSLTASAAHVAAQGFRAASIRLSGRVERDKEHTLKADLSGQDVFYNAFHARAILLSAAGTQRDHALRAELRSGKNILSVTVSGGYNEDAWKGRLTDLSGSDPAGRWKAQDPAALTISPDLVSLSRLVVTSTGGEYLELEGKMTMEPRSGTASVAWRNLDVSRANGWLTGMSLSGRSSGSISGRVAGEEPVVSGRLSLSRAVLRRRIQKAELKAEISNSEMSVTWQGRVLEAKLSLMLAGYGTIDASLQVPLPASMPIALDHDGPLQGAVKGSIRENGLLSFVFPGMVQESRGQVDIDLAVGGTWKAPAVKGSLLLDKAGGTFPAAGIRLADLRLEVQIERNVARITLKARSGPGWLQGKAAVDLEAWSVGTYEGSLQGDRFQALFLPQMRMLVSPAIRFSGTKKKLVVRGDVRVPELLIYGPPEEAAMKPSEDVVIVGQQEPAAKDQLAMDAEVRIILGDRVIVKAEGADAQLKGDVIVVMRSLEKVSARGEISVVKGKYSTYGVGLDIARGRVLFAGGPVENPSLDILAVKTVDDVKAGVLVTGTVRKPVVKLYSQPAMTDADVLSYIVLGRPLGAQDKEQTNALMTAAGALLSAGQSAALQDQMKQRLGVDVIDIQAGGGSTSRSLVTIGKYLSSRLYVSYGRALFTGENLFKVRYKLGKRLELESHSGETSGVDLYYTVQFD
jgi:autotransporter translocation and assembly factor TamB